MAVYKSKKPTKDGRQYFFRIKYKDIFGKVVDYTSPKFKSPKEAVNEEAIYRIKIQKHDINRNNPTFEQVFNEWFLIYSKGVKKQTTIKTKNLFKHLKNIWSIKINDLDINCYNRFKFEVDNLNFQISYKNKILGLLKTLIKYSNKYYSTSDNILKFIDNYKEVNCIKKEMDFFTYDEYKLFDSVIDSLEWHTFFEILYFLGLRQGECQALTWNDIDLNNNEIKIKKTLTSKIKGENWTISSPKTKNSIRTLPIPNNIKNNLKAIKFKAQNFKDFEESWFIFGNSIPYKESTINLHKNNYCKMANLKRIRIHDFRHSCASFLINKGASITLVSKYLGHSKVSITLDIYSHFYKSELNNITNIINNLN